MALSSWFPAGLAAVGRAQIDLEGDVLSLIAISDAYSFDPADEVIGDLSAVVIGSSSPVLGARTMVGGTLVTDTSESVLQDVPVGPPDVGGVVLFHDSSGTLLGIWQRNDDSTEIVIVTDGGDIAHRFTRPNGAGFEIVRI